MNRRGGVRVLVAAIVTVLAGIWTAIAQIPEPDSWWPKTWAGWVTILSLLGTMWLVFGPFMKERLRRFLCDPETQLLLLKLVVGILKADDVGLVIKTVVTQQFPERFDETHRMWEKIDALDSDLASMKQSFGEVVEPALARIEHSTAGLERQLRESRESTAKAIENALDRARQEFRDYGGRRQNPRGER